MSRSLMPIGSKSITVIFGFFALIGGLVSLAGWTFDAPRLGDWFGTGIVIQPNTALLLAISGLAFVLRSLQVNRLAFALAVIVMLIASLTLSEHILRMDFGFDQWLTFDRSWGQKWVTSRGRMGPPAALSLTLMGFALCVLASNGSTATRMRRWVPAIGIAIATLMLFSIAGFIFDAKSFYALPWLTAISFQTSLMLLALAFGLIVSVPEREPMLTLRDRSRTAVWARFVLPILIVLPMILSSLRVIGESWRLYDTGTGRALVSVVEIAVTVTLMWWTLTKLRNREQQEQATNRRFTDVLGSITDGLATVDRDWRYTLVNDAMLRRKGARREDLLGKDFLSQFPISADQSAQTKLQHAMSARVDVEFEYFDSTTECWYRDKAYPTADGGLAIYSHDITDRKRIERLINDRAQQFELLINQAPLGVFLVDANFKLAQVNPVAEPVFGSFEGGLLGRDFSEVIEVLFEKELAAEIVQIFRRTLETGEPYVAPEQALPRRDRGVVEFYDWRINRMLLPDEQFGVVCYFHDISPQVLTREKIAKSERRLRLVTDAMPALISYVDLNGCYQFNNKRYQEWFGYEADQLVGKPIREVLGDEAYERVRGNVEAALRGESKEFEGEIPYRNAGTRHVRAEYVPDVQPDGSVAGYYALIIDITQRKVAEDSLIKRNRQLSLLAGTSQELVFGGKSESDMLKNVFEQTLEAIDMEIFFNFIADDNGSLRLTASVGLTEDQKERIETIHLGQHLCGIVAQRREPLVVESVQSCELAAAQLIRDAGARCYVGIPLVVREQLLGTIAFATSKRDQLYEGELSLIQTICDQVAATIERGRLFENLRQSEERSRSLVAVVRASEERMQLAMTLADAGTWDHDLVTGKLHWSESHFRLLGYEPTPNHEATIDMWQNAIPPADRERLLELFEAAKQNQDLFHAEHRIRRLDGQEIWVKTAGRFFYDTDGKPLRFIGVFFDVTAAKQAEKALLDADRRKDEFLATLAHELRNPLAPLRNGVHLLKITQSQTDSNTGLVEMMERQVDHMVRLVDDLLEVSRITRGKIELRREIVDVGSLIRSAVEISASGIEAARHQLIVDVVPDSIAIDADPVRIAQVLSNLLNNAVKYTDEGGKIWVTARADEQQITLSVKDSGMGIPAEMLPKVFDLFTQIDRTLGRSQGGLGIGLALVKNLVELHGGTVEARSEGPGQGSEFILRLPRPASKRESDLSENEESGVTVDSKQRILVVDDNRDAANTLAILLRVIGAEVVTAYDGASAIQAMEVEKPEIVFLDLGMPGLDGYEVASLIRSRSEWHDVKLVALTGWGQDEDRRRTRDAGFNQHLTKPPDVAAVKAAIART